jgi:hypothetical protein
MYSLNKVYIYIYINIFIYIKYQEDKKRKDNTISIFNFIHVFHLDF